MNTTTSPCILQFKSQPIRLAETIIKSLPILMGVMLESQMVELRMDELSAGGLENPTASIKVSLDQRAEYHKFPGAGIPEVYAAWLKLESKLPPAKRLLWEWRRTVYVGSERGRGKRIRRDDVEERRRKRKEDLKNRSGGGEEEEEEEEREGGGRGRGREG
ncbi:SEI3 [Linum perenne]